jgi:hypothetical protein
MKKTEKNKKKGVYRSMEEIERKFFPKSMEEKRLSRMEGDPHTFEVDLAMESLQRVARQLAR